MGWLIDRLHCWQGWKSLSRGMQPCREPAGCPRMQSVRGFCTPKDCLHTESRFNYIHCTSLHASILQDDHHVLASRLGDVWVFPCSTYSSCWHNSYSHSLSTYFLSRPRIWCWHSVTDRACSFFGRFIVSELKFRIMVMWHLTAVPGGTLGKMDRDPSVISKSNRLITYWYPSVVPFPIWAICSRFLSNDRQFV